MTQAPATPELVERLKAMASMPFTRFHYADDAVMVKQAADALEAQQARIAELEEENRGLIALEPWWSEQAVREIKLHEETRALADRYEKALAYIAENDRSYLVAPTPGAKGYPGHYGHVARQALSSQGRHEGGER
ncbi:MAG TPA: hypothetical protein VM471_09490 [Phenylobacterium sp.]|jgi:hypothetical protein|nr:hypothetical protein [Phenylobacterium sp.]